ncbi:MAG: Cof-type HAD-IIB family hydrolase [Eubacterium sp.]|nr:Cof-type HAD-IIB family hydrolase [Eubacterium sp.]
MIKLIATDLDGTLMSGDHMTITPYTINTLEKAHRRGIKIAIATGRPLSLIDNVTNQVPFVDYVIYSNGACVYDRNENKIIYSNLILNSQVKEIVRYFLEKQVFFEVYIDGCSHYQLGTENLLDDMDMPSEFIDEVVASMTAHKNLPQYISSKNIEKVTLYSVKKCKFTEYEQKLLSYGLSVASSFKDNLEATAPSADKGEAVKGICEIMGINADECMTFGDAGNDVPMLRFAKYSFAMENGTDECKAAAHYVAKPNTEDGLAKAVEIYALKTV